MTATAGIINGTDLLIYDGTHAIAHCTSCSLSLSQEMRDASTKSSAGWKAVLPGQKSWQMEVQGFVALDASYNYAYFISLIANKTRVALKFRTANTEDSYYSGYGYLSGVNVDAPNQGNTTYTGTFIGDGAIAVNVGGIGPITWEPPIDGQTLAQGGMYDLTTNVSVVLTVPAVAGMSETIMIKNSSASGSIQLTCTDNMDGHTDLYISAAGYITLIPNVSVWDAIGSYADSEPT